MNQRLAAIVLLALCSLPTTFAREQASYELRSGVWSEDVPDLLRACGPQVRDEIASRVKLVLATGATQREADQRARTSVIKQTQDISGYDARNVVLFVAASKERQKSGNPSADQVLMLCLADRRLSQLDGAVVAGLKGASSKAPGGRP